MIRALVPKALTPLLRRAFSSMPYKPQPLPDNPPLDEAPRNNQQPDPQEVQFMKSLYQDFLKSQQVSPSQAQNLLAEQQFSFRVMQLTSPQQVIKQLATTTDPLRVLMLASRLRDFGYTGPALNRALALIQPVVDNFDSNQLLHFYRTAAHADYSLAGKPLPRPRPVLPDRLVELLLLVRQAHGFAEPDSWIDPELLSQVPQEQLANLLELDLNNSELLTSLALRTARADVLGSLCRRDRHHLVDRHLALGRPSPADQQSSNIRSLFSIVDYLKRNKGQISPSSRASLLQVCRGLILALGEGLEEVTQEEYVQLWLSCSIVVTTGTVDRQSTRFLLSAKASSGLSLSEEEGESVGVSYVVAGWRGEGLEGISGVMGERGRRFIKHRLGIVQQ